MATLLVAEHDNATLEGATAQGADRGQGASAATSMCWSPARTAGRRAEAAAKLDGVAKVLLADGDALAHQLAEPMAALIVALARQLRRDRRAGDHRRARTSCRASPRCST